MRVAEKLCRIAIRYANFAKRETRPFVNDVHWPAYVYVPVSVCLSVNHESRPWGVDLEIDRVDRSSRSSEREVESVDNIDSKSTFGSGICHRTRNQQTMNVPILCFTAKKQQAQQSCIIGTYLSNSQRFVGGMREHVLN